jgi:O-methyltransferase
MDALNALYTKMSPRGFIIVDDYGIPEDTCRRAITDFRSVHEIFSPIQDIDGWGVFWRR